MAAAWPLAPACVPSAILQQRPDVQQAERKREAASANMGAARAAFFSSISLIMTAGSASPQLDQLFSAGNGFFKLCTTDQHPIN